MDTLTFGNKTIEISRQAKIVFYAFIVILASMLVMMFIDPANIGMKIINFIFYIGMSLLVTYSVNCYVVGECNVLAWVGAILYILIAILTIVALIITVVMKVPKPMTMAMKGKASRK